MVQYTGYSFDMLSRHLASLGELSCRPLFSGYGVFADNTVFGMLAGSNFYLRICEDEQCQGYLQRHSPLLLTVLRANREICLDYYLVSEEFCCSPAQLLALSEVSLQAARAEKLESTEQTAIRHLPGMTVRLEHVLRLAGIPDVATLREYGAQKAWLAVYKIRRQLSVALLYRLESALRGHHPSLLPEEERQRLLCWYLEQVGKKNRDGE